MEDQPRASPPSDAPTVILECIKTTVIHHDGQNRKVILLFDSGSNVSCISPQLVQELNLPRRDVRTLHVGAFGSSTPISYDGATVSVDLLTQEGEPFRIDIATTLSGFPTMRMAPISEDQLTALRRDAIAVPVIREAPDILIGQDLFHLFERDQRPRLPQGFAVYHTILGPTISGAGRPTPTPAKDTACSGGLSPLLNLQDSPKDSGSSSPLLDLRERTEKLECSSPLLDISNSPKKTTTEAPSSFQWFDHRPPTDRDPWTRRWALLHFYHLNPLDTELEQKPDAPMTNGRGIPRVDDLLSGPQRPPDAPPARETQPHSTLNSTNAVLPSLNDDFFNLLSIFQDAVDVFIRPAAQRTLPSSARPTLKPSGSRHENLPTVPAVGRRKTDAVARPSFVEQPPQRTPLIYLNCSGPLSDNSLNLPTNFDKFPGVNPAASCTVVSRGISQFSAVSEQQPQMAKRDEPPSPYGKMLYSNIDDDSDPENNPYTQPTRKTRPKNRKPWSGASTAGPLSAADSTTTQAATSSAQATIGSEHALPSSSADSSVTSTTLEPKEPANEEAAAKSESGPLSDKESSTEQAAASADDADAAQSETPLTEAPEDQAAAAAATTSAGYQFKMPRFQMGLYQTDKAYQAMVNHRSRAHRKQAGQLRKKLDKDQFTLKIPKLEPREWAETGATSADSEADLLSEGNSGEEVPSSTEDAAVAVQSNSNASCTGPLSVQESGGPAQAEEPGAKKTDAGKRPPKIISKAEIFNQRMLEKVAAQTKAAEKTAKKIMEQQQAAVRPPRRPISPHPVIELAAARNARTIKELRTAVKELYDRWKHTQPPGPAPRPFSALWKEKHPYGKRLWAEYQQLEADVYAREQEDAAKATTVTTSTESQQPPAADSPAAPTGTPRSLNEWEQRFMASDEFNSATMTVADVREACRELFGTPAADEPEELDYNEEMPLVLPPPPQPPADDELMEGIAELLSPTSASKPAVASGEFRNPSPPPQAGNKKISLVLPKPPRMNVCPPFTKQSLGLAPCQPRDPPDNHKTAITRVKSWLHSQAAAGQPPSPPKKDTSKSSSREGHESRPQSGNKRTLAVTSSSTAPPAQRPRNREASRSPVRDQSPGVYRKNMLRVEAKQPPLPIMDGFVCKEYAILAPKLGQQITDTQWIGGHFQRIPANAAHPMADETRKEFDEEQSIVPSHLILGHCFGAFPDYAQMVTQMSRLTLSTKLQPTAKYFSELRCIGILTGFDLRGPDEAYFRDLEDQRTAMVRLARAARHSERAISIMVNFDRERPNFDPHADAIEQLRIAELKPDHPVHLVSFDGSILNTLKWLEAFPNVVIGLSLHPIATGLAVLEKQPPNTQLYRDTEVFRTFLQRVPLRNIAIQSGCPIPMDDMPGHHYSPDQLIRIGNVFAHFIDVPGAGPALYTHSAENLRRTYNLSKELLKNLAQADDLRPDRLNREQFIAGMRALYLPAVARADPSDQNGRRRSSVTEAAPMQGVEEGAAAASQPKHRSQSARGRQSQSPTKSKDGRGRPTDKQKKGSKTGPLSVAEPAQSSSKSATLADKDSKPRGEKKEHTSRGDHRSTDTKDERPRTTTPFYKLQPILVDTEAEDKKPALQSQAIVPEKSRSASTGGLRIVVPRSSSPTFKRPRTPMRIIVKQDDRADARRAASSRAASLQPTANRIPVAQRLGLATPTPFNAQDSLKEFQQRRSGRVPGSLSADSVTVNEEPDPLLMREPVLVEVTPPPSTTAEYLNYADRYFIHERSQETGRKNTRVDLASLATEGAPRAQRDIIQVTHGCDLPWDLSHFCEREDELGHFHKTLEETNLIGTRFRWLKSGGIKKNQRQQEFLDTVMDLTVRSFGQMILIKFGARLRYNDAFAIEVLKFIHAVLIAGNADELPRILAQRHRHIIRAGYENPWPNYDDFERAAEAWSCYCEEAFIYLFHRLSGPATWTTNWTLPGVLPEPARQFVIHQMVARAQEMFDNLRHQLYVQYGRLHIEAENRLQFRWTRFDEHLNSRTETKAEDELRTPTVCFVDAITKATFSDDLRPDVAMITIPNGSAKETFAFFRSFYPTGCVNRIVLWFGRHFLLDRRREYHDLVAVLCHHFHTFFPGVQLYVVIPAYMRDRFDLWQEGPLAVFLNRQEMAAHAHVAIDNLYLSLWFADAKKLNTPLPAYIDDSGLLLTDEAIRDRKVYLAGMHGLDLWQNLVAKQHERPKKTIVKVPGRVPGPLSYSPPPPTNTGKKIQKSAPVLLADAPSTSKDTAPLTSTAADIAYLRDALGLDKIATHPSKIQEQLASQMDASLSVLEHQVSSAERDEAMDDSDALSEATPDKNRESKQ